MYIELDFKKCERIEQPAAYITLDKAKKHLRVDHDDDDTLIDGLIATGCSYVEGEGGLCGYPIGAQKWRLTLYPPCHIDEYALEIEKPFVTGITSVKYYDYNNNLVTADLNDWAFMSNCEETYIYPVSNVWPIFAPRADAFEIEFTIERPIIPPEIESATLIILTALYDNRGDSDFEIPKAAHNLINLKRKGWIG